MLGTWSGELGLDPDAFWRQTPRTYLAITNAYRRKLEGEQSSRAWLAWHIGVLGRVKKFPKLKDLMPRKRSKGRKSQAELQAAAEAWRAETTKAAAQSVPQSGRE